MRGQTNAYPGKLTAHRLVQGYLDRIAAYDKRGQNINSIITLSDHALEDADRLDSGRLAGCTGGSGGASLATSGSGSG